MVRALSSTCDILGDEDALLGRLAATALRSCIRRQQDGLVVLDARRLAAADIALARRMVRLAVGQLDPEARLEMRHVEAVLACVAAGEGSVTLPGGIDARMEFGALALRTPAAHEELAAGWLTVPGRMALANEAVLEARLERIPAGCDPVARARELTRAAEEEGRHVVALDAAALGYAERDLARLAEAGPELPAEARTARLWVDAPAPGDVMCPLGMHGRSKKLSDLLGAERIPVSERTRVPVVRTAPGGAVAWVGGVRLDERFKCTPATRILVVLTILPATAASTAHEPARQGNA